MDSLVRGYRVRPLAEILADEFRDRASRADLAMLIGERDWRATQAWVDELTVAQLGVHASGALFAWKSVGAVFALLLETGEPAVLKLFNRSYSRAELAAMHRCLGVARAHRFPVPGQRSELFEAAQGVYGAFYTYIDGEHRDAHDPSVRRELARSLAELNGLLAPLGETELPPAPGLQEALWPKAQRLWELREIAPDDEDMALITEHASAAQRVLKKSKLPQVAAHLDWGVKNLRFRDDAVCAVYDADSIHLASEAECVGRAAAQFTAQWDIPALLTPTPKEAKAFVDEYQAARGRKFSRTERTIAAAAARYLVAQVARLELLSGVPEGDNYRGLMRSYADHPLL
jgi:hypothetical protein